VIEQIGTGRYALYVKREQIEQLHPLPGAYLNTFSERVEGAPDVIEAAAKRLNVSLTMPEPMPLLHVGGEVTDRLREYQKHGVLEVWRRLQAYGGAVLADDMGLGKTLQAITVGKVVGGRRLVVAPGAVRETWRDDLRKWGEENVAILGPQTTKAKKAEWDRAKTAAWVVTSYEMAQQVWDHAFRRSLPSLLIIDEAHMLAGRKSIRGQTLKTMGVMSKYRLALTGSPVWDRPRNLHQLLSVVLGSRAFGSSYDFDLAYCAGFINEHGGMDNRGASRTDELRRRLSHYMVRREKKDVLQELPPLTRTIRWVEATPKATKAFDSFALRIKGTHISDALEATLDGKMKEAARLAAEVKRFVLFTWTRAHAHKLAKMLVEEHDTPCVSVTGDMSTDQRQREIKAAASLGIGVVATMDSVGTGVDALKHVAQTAIFHAISYKPQLMAQAEARLHRLGQTGNVQAIYLAMKDSADQLVVDTVVEKLDQFSQLVGGDTSMKDELTATTNGMNEEELMTELYDLAMNLRGEDSDDD
jgi:SNF2 family DNA or RNA helicase